MRTTPYHPGVLRWGVACLLLLLSVMIAAPARAVDLTITSGQDISLDGELNFDIVNIGSGGKLRLAAGSRLTCYRLFLSGRLIISGDVSIVVKYHEVAPAGVLYAMVVQSYASIETDYYAAEGHFARAADGADGADGPDGGYAGIPGGNGADGRDGYSLSLFVDGDIDVTGEFGIYLRGEDGGHGGDGGDGGKGVGGNCGLQAQPGGPAGNGGKAGRGGKGGSLNFVCLGKITSTSAGGWKPRWAIDGGYGGSGGNGGKGGHGGWGNNCSPDPLCKLCSSDANGGLPGLGGDNGRGGDGGTLYLGANRVEKYTTGGRIWLGGGQGGQNSMSGEGGRGPVTDFWGSYDEDGERYYCTCGHGISQMGGEGRASDVGGGGGAAKIVVPCGMSGFDSSATLTVQANGGLGCRGIGAGKLCQLHPSYYGVDGAEYNDSAVGGLGGSITVNSGHVEYLTLQAGGGQGGHGSNGGNLWSSGDWDCSTPGGSGGKGGQGGPGGNGGTISVIADDIAASTTGTAAGGVGGLGGLGGYAPEPLCYRGDAGKVGVTGDDGIYAQTVGEAFSAQLSASPSIALPGGVVQYTVGVTAKNNETGVTVSLPLPAHTIFVDASAGYNLNGGTLSWNIGDLSSCQLKSFWVRLRMGANLQGGDVVSAQALAARSIGAADMSDASEVTTKSDGFGLRDAILALKIMAKISTAGYDVDSAVDVDGDHKIGLPEAIYILQKISGER